MQVEGRPKNLGIKIHLDGEETELILSGAGLDQEKLRKKVAKLLKEHPEVLEARTPEDIKAALIAEKTKAEAKLKEMNV